SRMVGFRKGFGVVKERRYWCIEDLILQHGAVFEWRSTRNPIPRACFQQAYRLAARSGSQWIYVEGFALHPVVGFAAHHAWVARRDDPRGAVEVAWEDADANTAYLGVAFRAAYVREAFRLSGRASFSVLDTPWMGFPVLSGATPIEAVAWSPAKGQV